MAANKFNTDIPDAVITQVMSLLADIETALKPYMVSLSKDEKAHMPTIADKTIAFAQKADGYLDTAPQFNPAFVDVAETHKDLANFEKVQPVLQRMASIEGAISDISAAAGSDAYVQYLAYYSSVGRATDMGVAGAQAIYDELSLRFPGRGKKQTPPANG